MSSDMEPSCNVPPDYLTSAQLGELAQVSRATISRWVADGSLTAVRLPGGRYRFRRSDVEALLTPRVAPASEAAS